MVTMTGQGSGVLVIPCLPVFLQVLKAFHVGDNVIRSGRLVPSLLLPCIVIGQGNKRGQDVFLS